MPRELRYIILSREEITQALNSYRRIVSTGLPGGDITSVEPGEQNDLKVAIATDFGSTGSSIEIVVGPKHLVPMLIRYCYENNIPLPRIGKKGCRSTNGELALVIRIDEYG